MEFNGKIEITDNSPIGCGWCQVKSTAKRWHENTYKECTSREMRREYRPITNIKSWSKTKPYFYKCPNCGKWNKGSQLRLYKEDGTRVSGIGGENPISFGE